MKVVAFNGSPRPDGNTAQLLRAVLDVLAREGIETELVQIAGQPLRGCTACYGCFAKKDGRCAVTSDALNEYVDKMVQADGILLGSPTYFSDVTAEMKALIDRAGLVTRANGALLRRKVAAGVVAVRRGGEIHAFDTLNHFFLIGEMIVPGSSYWNMAFGLEKGQVQGDQEGMETMRVLGTNMAWLLRKLHGSPG